MDQDTYNELNSFKIIHIYNQSNTYHLTRQILINSAIILDTYSFFYHILSMDIDVFNEQYCSFAYLTTKNLDEAILYINVNPEALSYIINFIQTNKIKNMTQDYFFDEIIDLATMFAMPNLIEIIENIKQDFYETC